MTSWFSKRLSLVGGNRSSVIATDGSSTGNSSKTVDHKAWFLCKLLTQNLDESTYEQVRHRLVQSKGGVETRVRLTADGWTSGSKKSARRLPTEVYPISSIEALTVDTVHSDVLLCIIRGDSSSVLPVPSSPTADESTSRRPPLAISSGMSYQIIAYRFTNESTSRRFVECFESLRSDNRKSTVSDAGIGDDVTPETANEKRAKKPKSRYQKHKNTKAAASEFAGDNDADQQQQKQIQESAIDGNTLKTRKQGLILGRPAALGNTSLAPDRWTVRNRQTPRLFASKSLDDLLSAGLADVVVDVGGKSSGADTQPGLDAGIDRSISLDNCPDGETAGEGEDLEEAAEAEESFWRETNGDEDNGIQLPAAYGTLSFGVFKRPLGAKIAGWSSLDDLDRHAIDDWSSTSGDSGGGGNYSDSTSAYSTMVSTYNGTSRRRFGTEEVGITVRCPAAWDPKSRPERMDCYRFRHGTMTAIDDEFDVIEDSVVDAQCQVDMPRLRPPPSEHDAATYSTATIASSRSEPDHHGASAGVSGLVGADVRAKYRYIPPDEIWDTSGYTDFEWDFDTGSGGSSERRPMLGAVGVPATPVSRRERFDLTVAADVHLSSGVAAGDDTYESLPSPPESPLGTSAGSTSGNWTANDGSNRLSSGTISSFGSESASSTFIYQTHDRSDARHSITSGSYTGNLPPHTPPPRGPTLPVASSTPISPPADSPLLPRPPTNLVSSSQPIASPRFQAPPPPPPLRDAAGDTSALDDADATHPPPPPPLPMTSTPTAQSPLPPPPPPPPPPAHQSAVSTDTNSPPPPPPPPPL